MMLLLLQSPHERGDDMPTQTRAPRITIDVTQEVIQAAIPADSSHCMIAEAVPDKIGGTPPPLSRYARRRAFGLRALVR
jgi:hypothetical protein